MATSTAILSYALIGEIKLYSSNTIPDGWLVCDGSAVSRTTYASLFSVIGTTYGSGDGSTTFNLPDFKGRTAIGVGESSATGHTAHTLGQMDGEETHTQTTSELARHSHTYTTYSGGPQAGGSGNYVWAGTKSVSTGTTPSSATVAMNNMQPYTCINYIIYASISE